MARRNEGILDSLVMVPWWVSVLVSAGAYVLLAYVAPAFLGQQDRPLGPLSRELPRLAPMVALLFLIPAPLSAFRGWRARRLLDTQTGLDSIRAMSWQRFETLVAEAYRREGYGVEETGGGGPDGGVDLIVRKGGVFLVQCKHWRTYRVGVREARELLGVVTADAAAGGILVTSGRFTPDAKRFARGKPLQLVDGRRLLALVRLAQRAPSAVAATAREAETALDEVAPPPCPACGRYMVMRIAKRGSAAGSRFWGCSGYPDCRGTIRL